MFHRLFWFLVLPAVLVFLIAVSSDHKNNDEDSVPAPLGGQVSILD
jgi:hypothetical protein